MIGEDENAAIFVLTQERFRQTGDPPLQIPDPLHVCRGPDTMPVSQMVQIAKSDQHIGHSAQGVHGLLERRHVPLSRLHGHRLRQRQMYFLDFFEKGRVRKILVNAVLRAAEHMLVFEWNVLSGQDRT